MSIDTGLNLSYNKNFPVANINQSSQTFRDNFYIIKTAIENLQVGAATGNSVLSVQSSVATSGAIQFDVQFKSNSFKLPLNTVATGEGLIRYNTTTKNLEFYNTAWSAVIGYDANGAVNLTTLHVSTKLTVASSPTVSTDVVNLGYLNGVVSTISNTQSSQYTILSNTVANNSNAIIAEVAARIAGDAALANAIASLANAVNIQNSASNVVQLATDLNNLSNALAVEAGIRAGSDSNLQNSIAIQANTINQHTAQIASLTQGEIDEASYRASGDAYLYTLINAIVLADYATSNALHNETNSRVATDNYINGTVTALNSKFVTANIHINTLQTQVDSFDAIINSTYSNYPRVFIQNVAPTSNAILSPNTAVYISNNSLWFDNSNSNALSYYDGNTQVWSPIDLPVVTTFENTTVFFQNSNVVIDTDHFLLFQTVPNQANGTNDKAYITYDANNFDYMPFNFISNYPNAVVTNGSTVRSNIITTYGSLANASSHYEFSALRLGTQNESGGTMFADSMALEPSSDLYLNPGWISNGTSRTQFANSAIYGQTTGPFSVVDVRQYTYVVVGNSSERVFTINAGTGDVTTKGDITADGNIAGLSDISVKKDLVRIEHALDKITSISGYTFTRTDLPNNPVQMGVIAQEVNEIAPELITHLPNGKMAVSYGNMGALFIEALKEIKAELNEIKKRLG